MARAIAVNNLNIYTQMIQTFQRERSGHNGYYVHNYADGDCEYALILIFIIFISAGNAVSQYKWHTLFVITFILQQTHIAAHFFAEIMNRKFGLS